MSGVAAGMLQPETGSADLDSRQNVEYGDIFSEGVVAFF